MAQNKITRLHLISILFFALITLLAVQVMSYDDRRTAHPFDIPPIPVHLQSNDIQTYVGLNTKFIFESDMEYVGNLEYCWDYDSDGKIDWSSHKNAESYFEYSKSGIYAATLSISGTEYPTPEIQITVKVDDGFGSQSRLDAGWYKSLIQRAQGTNKSGANKYALIVSTSGESRFFVDNTRPWYYFLRDSVGLADSNIYVVTRTDSTDTAFLPYIDFDIYLPSTIDSAFYLVSQKLTPLNDEFYLIITGHGMGLDINYKYPHYVNYDPSENTQDLCEDSLHYIYNREYYHKSMYYTFERPHPFNEIGLYYYDLNQMGAYRNQPITIYRHILKSHFTNMPYYDSLGNIQYVSDSDVYLEQFRYYPLGDSNRDGIIAREEIWDWDNDGNPPAWIDTSTQTVYYDEDDWDTIPSVFNDQWKAIFYPYTDEFILSIVDADLNDTVDIDAHAFEDLINYPESLDVDGTDLNCDGKLMTIDFNDDGDMIDSLAIDENLANGTISDDWVADWIDSLAPAQTYVFMQNCYSGGFIGDLSRGGLIIGTASDTRVMSGGQQFLEYMCSIYVDISLFEAADVDSNDCVSIVEAYNAIPYNYPYRYDDNGDFNGHAAPLPNGGDGTLGSNLSFTGYCLVSDTGYVYGDADSSGTCNVADAVYINTHIFQSGPAPKPLNAGDPNGDCSINVGDVTYIVNYVFNSGAEPVAGCVE